MTPEETIRLAFSSDLACPGLGAELVLEHRNAPVVRAYIQYLRQTKSLPALPDTVAGQELSALLGIPTQLVEGSAGIHSLATYPLGTTERIGAVRRFVAEKASERNRDEFAEACTCGELAAWRWLRGQVGFFNAAPLTFHPLVLKPIDAPETPHESLGRSAGLAACLAAAYKWLGDDSTNEAIAATGIVSPEGEITGVDQVEAKLTALLREAPFVKRLVLPEENRADIPAALAQQFTIEFVAHANEALLRIFGNIEASRLPAVDRLGAAQFAVELETHKDHARAHALASALVESLESDPPGPDDLNGCKAEALARTVLATNLNHQGHAKRAREQFAKMHATLASASEKVRARVLRSKTRARLAASEASIWIDTLSPERAIETCEPLVELADDLDDEVGIALLGSWTRGLAAAGRLDEAEVASDRQLDFLLEERQEGQRVQAMCNRLDILLRKHHAGDSHALDQAESRHEEALRLNQNLPEGPQRSSNALFLRYWQIQLHAAAGNADAATETAGDVPDTGRFPSLYWHRFVAEALANQGRPDDAIALLGKLVSAISPDAGAFEKLILHTANARLATILIELCRDGWQEPARTFLEMVANWSPDFLELPRDKWDDPGPVAEAIEATLRRLPY